MATKVCPECGVKLTAWNHGFFSSKCSDCVRVPFARSKAFFERTKVSEQDIQRYPLFRSALGFIGHTLFVLACLAVASMAGVDRGGPFVGWWYGVIGGLVGIVISRLVATRARAHPLHAKRWYSYAVPCFILLLLVWVGAYMALMPTIGTLGSRTLFSYHVALGPSISVPAFSLVLAIGAAAAIVGAVLGMVNMAGSDRRHKANTLAHFRRWRQTASQPRS